MTREVGEKMDIDKLLAKANRCIQEKISIGQEFKLQTLFDGCEWSELTLGDRRTLGRCFASEVRSGNIANTVAIESKGVAKYRKVP